MPNRQTVPLTMGDRVIGDCEVEIDENGRVNVLSTNITDVYARKSLELPLTGFGFSISDSEER